LKTRGFSVTFCLIFIKFPHGNKAKNVAGRVDQTKWNADSLSMMEIFCKKNTSKALLYRSLPFFNQGLNQQVLKYKR